MAYHISVMYIGDTISAKPLMPWDDGFRFNHGNLSLKFISSCYCTCPTPAPPSCPQLCHVVYMTTSPLFWHRQVAAGYRRLCIRHYAELVCSSLLWFQLYLWSFVSWYLLFHILVLTLGLSFAHIFILSPGLSNPDFIPASAPDIPSSLPDTI